MRSTRDARVAFEWPAPPKTSSILSSSSTDSTDSMNSEKGGGTRARDQRQRAYSSHPPEQLPLTQLRRSFFDAGTLRKVLRSTAAGQRHGPSGTRRTQPQRATMPAEALSNSTRWPKPLRDHRGAGPLDTSHLLFRDHLSAHSTGARATSETSFRGQAQLDTGAQHRRGKVRGGAPSTTCGTENLRRPSRAQVPLRYFWTGEVR